MISSEKQQADVISRIKNGASVKEISEELKISPATIYNFLRATIPSDNSIQFDSLPLSTQIKLLTIEENYEAALELCNKEENLYNKNIQEQQVRILLLMYEKTQNKELLEKALTICENNNDIKSFNKLKRKIELYSTNSDDNIETTMLLTNIYYGTISKEEIENSTVNPWEKSLLLVSYFEKNNKKNGILYLKNLKKEYQEEKEKLKILNLLYDRLNCKKDRIFDVSTYTGYLKCTINPTLVKKKEKEESQVIKKVSIDSRPLIIKESKKTEKKEPVPKLQNNTNNTKYNRYNRYSNGEDNQKQNIKVSEPIVRSKYIKEIFPLEVLAIGKYLYVEMNNIEKQRIAIQAWDNFECLINKTIDDVEAMKRMVRILKKFQKEGLLSQTENYDDIKTLKKNIY